MLIVRLSPAFVVLLCWLLAAQCYSTVTVLWWKLVHKPLNRPVSSAVSGEMVTLMIFISDHVPATGDIHQGETSESPSKTQWMCWRMRSQTNQSRTLPCVSDSHPWYCLWLWDGNQENSYICIHMYRAQTPSFNYHTLVQWVNHVYKLDNGHTETLLKEQIHIQISESPWTCPTPCFVPWFETWSRLSDHVLLLPHKLSVWYVLTNMDLNIRDSFYQCTAAMRGSQLTT